MTGYDYGERFHTSHVIESTEENMNSPATTSDALADKVPAEASGVRETPETPVGGSVAAVGPLGETIVHEAQTTEMMPYKAPVGEPVADESGVSKPVPYGAAMGETITPEVPAGTNAGSSAALISREESERFRTRWNRIQGTFVDEPRSAVQQADALVSEVVGQVTQMLASEHGSLKSQWNQGSDLSTEDLRRALQRYRAFFNRLVV